MSVPDQYKMKPLPKTVILKEGTSIPIFNDGTEWYTIIDADTGEEFAKHRFMSPDPAHPDAADYKVIQYEIAERLAKVINAGLEAMRVDFDPRAYT